MKIGIPLSRFAYTPEAYAYDAYLKKFGYETQLDYDLDPDNDINIHFMGIRPFWRKKEGRAKEIHEYQSLSIPPYSYLKDLIKKRINKKPDSRIFLNEIVYSNFTFNDDIPYIFRDMGVDELFFQKPSENPKYDIVYCGSINNRVGLIECLLRITKLGFKIIVVGDISENDKLKFLGCDNINFYGRATRDEIVGIYKECKYGLNFTPDIYPYNIQTSTKTLEYLASGLEVISNKYIWSENLSKSYDLIWLNDFLLGKKNYSINSLNRFTFRDKYSWDSVLEKSNLSSFLKQVVD